jgi:NAD(P)-dependent dehydrogenase (short-subunit alcohol dehydrogenase family)
VNPDLLVKNEVYMEINGQVALITGAGSGLGKAAALLLAEDGVKIAALGRTKHELEQTVEEVERRGSEGMALEADISDESDMKQVVDRIEDRWGRLDIVFANAGINGVWAPLDKLKLEEWKKTIDINLTGTFLTVKSALPLIRRHGGSIIITSSINGTRTFSNTGATAYACSKAAQVAFTKMLAVELAKDKIRVNVICPGAIESDIDENTQKRDLEDIQIATPEGKIPLTGGEPGTSAQVARLVRFLASPASSHITGTELWIDGGQSLI